MSRFSQWLKGSLGDLFPMFGPMSRSGEGAANNIFNKIFGTGLTSAEKEANAFNASEAQRGRDFTAAQADRDRAWQEEQMEKYNSLSGKIQQARDAGVNTMYAVTGNAVSPSSASGHTPSAPTASSVSPQSGNIGGLISSMLGAFKTKAEIDVLKSEAHKNESQATGQDIYNTYADALHSGNVDKIQAETAKIFSETELTDARLNEVTANIQNIVADTKLKYQDYHTAAVQRDKLRSETQAVLQGIEESAKRMDLYDEQIRNIVEKTKMLTYDIKVYSDSSVHDARVKSFTLSNQNAEVINKINEIKNDLMEYEKKYSQQRGHGAFTGDASGVAPVTRFIEGISAVTAAVGNIFRGQFVTAGVSHSPTSMQYNGNSTHISSYY